MASCRFGLFPNVQDCSPLLLSEAIVRNIPVLVNQDILGGWKYVNENTGSFFNYKRDITPSLDMVLDGKFNPCDWFMSEYGFEKAASRFAQFGRKHFKTFAGCEMACFSKFSPVLSKFSKK